MSQENVEIVRRGYEYFGTTRDFRPEGFHDDFVWDMSTFRGWPERQTYHGIEGAREFMAAWLDAWEEWELVVEELYETGVKVVAVLAQRGRAKTSGLPVEMHFVQVWTFDDGKQIRMEMYADAEQALEAVGLQE